MEDGEKKLDKYYYDLYFPPLTGEENFTNSTVNYAGWGFLGGLSTGAYRSVMRGRPPLAGWPLSLLMGVGLAVAADAYRRGLLAYKEYTVRRAFYYMTLHPEDFPPPERIKFADYWDTWETNR
ncbi:uncharacterized protein LOC100901931 [Galendromus occidentalis]|uniref:Uncharacterized protein LOC100901931 n=1 Tax=Galendromus occidentalis TaxID=34638 RepID=A0AAJ6QUK0_9ACAR|nr:uncharacterized protein LOC100901931 [Galendromus occidentalis]